MKLITEDDIKNIPVLDQKTMEELGEAIEKIADYEKAESFEEFLGMKIARKIYKELIRTKRAKKEIMESKGRELAEN